MPGPIGKTASPTGTAEKNSSSPMLRRGKRLFQPSLRDYLRYRQTPAFETPGYFQNVPFGTQRFSLSKY
jgi:hypothetical protein